MNMINYNILEHIRKRSKFMPLCHEYINIMSGVRHYFTLGTICLLSGWFMLVLGYPLIGLMGILIGFIFFFYMVERSKTWDFYLKEAIK